EVVARQGRVLDLGQEPIRGDQDVRVCYKARVARDDDALSGQRADGDDSMLVHRGDLLVVRGEGREAGHVADAAVRVMSLNEQTLRGALVVAPLFGKDDETPKRGFVGDAVGHAFAQPADEELMGFGTALEAEAAFVRDGGSGLPDDEAFVRRGGKDPSAARVLDDMR